MSTVNITLESEAVDALFDRMGDDVEALRRAILEAAANTMADIMREIVPVRSGFMKDSITADDYGDSFLIGPNSGYSLFVDQGTQGPYDIYPRSARALRIELDDGTVLFRRHAEHPGIQGVYFIDQTLADSEAEISATVEAAIEAFFEGGL
jgi:hypothetical protein